MIYDVGWKPGDQSDAVEWIINAGGRVKVPVVFQFSMIITLWKHKFVFTITVLFIKKH